MHEPSSVRMSPKVFSVTITSKKRDVHEVGLHIGILLHDLLGHLAPQTAGSQHVGLVNDGNVTAALPGILVGHAQDALHLGAAVVVGVPGLIGALLFLAEVHAAGQLAYADEVGAAHQFVLQRRLVDEAVERLHRADVGIEAQPLAHGQQALLGAYLGRGVVVELGVAHTGKEHGIGLLTGLVRLLGEGIAHLVDSMCTAKCFLVTHFVTELLGYSRQDGHALLHNLWSDSVTGQYCNLQFHTFL